MTRIFSFLIVSLLLSTSSVFAAKGIWAGPNGDQSCFGPGHNRNYRPPGPKKEEPCESIVKTTSLGNNDPLICTLQSEEIVNWLDGNTHNNDGVVFNALRIAKAQSATNAALITFNEDSLKRWMYEVFGRTADTDKVIPGEKKKIDEAKFESSVTAFNPSLPKDGVIGIILKEGFFSPPSAENAREVRPLLKSLFAALEADKENAVEIKSRTGIWGEGSSDESIHFTAVSYLNKKSGKVLTVLIREKYSR